MWCDVFTIVGMEWNGMEVRNKCDRKYTVAEMVREGRDAIHTVPYQSFNLYCHNICAYSVFVQYENC